MSKLSTPRYYSECKKEEPNNIEKKRTTSSKSRIPVKKTGTQSSVINTKTIIISNTLQAEELNAKTENAVQQLQEKSIDVLEVGKPDAKKAIDTKQSREKPTNLLQVEETDATLKNIEQLKEKPKIEDSEANLENEIKSLPRKPRFANILSKHIQEEIKMNEGLTAQDIFRLRIPKPRNLIENVCSNCTFLHVSEPRYRKPIVVLDLDTLRLIYPAIVPDRKPTILNLLESVYKSFDIAIWSSMKMEDVISKLEMLELFRIQNRFKLNFVLDKTAMTTPFITKNSLLKDMEVIWNLYPQYNEHNSIIVNDYLKNIIYAIYKVPVKKTKTIQLVDEVALSVVMEFLADTFCSQQSLIELNTLMANKYYK